MNKPPMIRAAMAGLLIVAVSIVLFQFRFLTPDGADGFFLSKLIENETLPFYYRSIFTVWMHRLAYVALHPWGFDGWDAMAYSSSLAGGVGVYALLKISKHPLFLAINVLSGAFLVFVGHAENYAWVNAFLLLAFLGVRDWLDGRRSLYWAMIWFLMAALSHMLTLFYVPAMAYVLWKERRYNPLEALIPVIVFTLIITLGSLCFTMLGTDIGLERLMPVFEPWAPNQFIPLISWAHLDILFYFHRTAAFLGIPLELPLLILLGRRVNTRFLRFMLIASLCGIAWTSVWHPDWDRQDWDLFSQFAIPLHVLTGLLASQWIDEIIAKKTHIGDAKRG